MASDEIVLNESWLVGFADRTEVLWVLAFLLYGIGDTVTTLVGLRAEGIEEVGPVALYAMELGGDLGFFFLKIGFLSACFLVWWQLETHARVAIPLALIVAGAAVTTWNLIMLTL